MNTEQQDKLWNDLNEESKEHILSIYKELDEEYEKYKKEGEDNFASTRLERLIMLEDLFGEHNLNPKPPTPKTWEDVEKEIQYIKEQSENIDNSLEPCICFDEKISDKMIATLKIAKLIELGYGGMVSEEEWWNDNTLKYYIKCNPHKSESSIECTYHASVKYFIAFHTQQQAEEFMSHESNRRLVQQYYLM